ncbi:MAG: hypothetical protein L6Q76_13180 [Polyangiaceae bacterium]|nr:hypothetical protein [Polyangiaceae bacterium]
MRSNSDPLTVDEVKLFVDAVPAWYRDVYDVWPEFTRATVALHHRCLFAKACLSTSAQFDGVASTIFEGHTHARAVAPDV